MPKKAVGDPPHFAKSAAATIPADHPDASQVRQELERIVQSREFSGTERGRSLLTYLVENALAGGLERLKERTIGVEIFGRDAAYDTGQDAIVRVSANSVRKRIAAHYARLEAEGRNPPLQILLPAGSYVPEFHVTQTHSDPWPAAETVDPSDQSGPAPARARLRWLWPALTAILTVACAALAYQNSRLRPESSRQAALNVLPWSAIAKHPDTRIVLTDANFTLHRFLLRRELSLAEYSSQKWLWDLRSQAPTMPPLAGILYTSVASALTAGRISSLLERSGYGVSVQSSRNMQVSDFKEARPVILLGSAPSNPWVELFNDRLNFVVELDENRRMQRCRNSSPRPGELSEYIATTEGVPSGIAYAAVALLPNLADRSPVLLISGTNAEATEAAGELLVDIPRLTKELSVRGVDPHGSVRQLEMLIRVNCMNQQNSRSEVIALRTYR